MWILISALYSMFQGTLKNTESSRSTSLMGQAQAVDIMMVREEGIYQSAQQAFLWGWAAMKVPGTEFSLFCPGKTWCVNQEEERGGGEEGNTCRQTPGFSNCLLDLSCLSAHTKISCCPWLSELSRACQNMSETTSAWNGEISMNLSNHCRLLNCNLKIKFGNFKRKNCKSEVLELICQC